MNPELCRQALAKVGNPNVLVNLVSRRVRQLTAGGGGTGRPLIENWETLGWADVALREIIEDKMSWEMPDLNMLTEQPKPKRRKKS
jgi:DNA-directed RNA polymerase subunit omega